ncbi:MAG: DUF2227 family putative metal-binding protein [Chlamydiota bacterium]
MPQYRTHTTCNVFFLPLILGALVYFFHSPWPYLVVFGSSFLYGTYFMNPDMDMAGQIKLFSWKGLFTLPFRVYALFFHHRGISHRFLLGTLTRIIFLAGIIFLFLFLFHKVTFHTDTFVHFITVYKTPLIYLFLGLLTADTCHLLLDLVKSH